VVGVERAGRLTRAEIELDSEFAPIPADTRTIIRRKTLLGEAYIELSPGTPVEQGGESLADGGELPFAQTAPTVELDEVLRAFDPATRGQIRAVLAELARGVGERDSELSGALGTLPPAVDDLDRLASVLRSQRAPLRSLVQDTGTALAALAERRGALRSLTGNAARVFEATARQQRELTETVRILPVFLGELRPTLALARDVGLEAEPLLDDIEPVAGELPPTLRDLHSAAPSLRGLFRDLGPAIAKGERAFPPTARLLDTARPLTGALHTTLRDAGPVVDWLALYERELATWLPKLAAPTQATAGEGPDARHLLRILLLLNEEGVAVHGQRVPGNRHNPYSKPGYLTRLTDELRAYDCAGAQPQPDAPPCVPQGPFSFRGFTGSYPHVTEQGR
jgi:ABC-type transporter Mla subunit MlaD